MPAPPATPATATLPAPPRSLSPPGAVAPAEDRLYRYADLVEALGERVGPPLLALSILVHLLSRLADARGDLARLDASHVWLGTDPAVLLADATRDPRLHLIHSPALPRPRLRWPRPRWLAPRWLAPRWLTPRRQPHHEALHQAARLAARLVVPPAARDEAPLAAASLPWRLRPLFAPLLAADGRHRPSLETALAASRALAAAEMGCWLERRHRRPPPAARPCPRLPEAFTDLGARHPGTAHSGSRRARRALSWGSAAPLGVATLLSSLIAAVLLLGGP